MPAAALLALLLAAADPPPAPASAGRATLVVQIEGLKGDQGKVHVSLYASEDGFPTKPEKALRQVDAPITGGRSRVVFASEHANVGAAKATTARAAAMRSAVFIGTSWCGCGGTDVARGGAAQPNRRELSRNGE